jgi:hypothetical protein
MERTSYFEGKWGKLLANGKKPEALHRVREMEFSAFSDLIMCADLDAAGRLVEQIFEGEAIILKNAIPIDKVEQLKQFVFAFEAANLESHNEIVSNCPDWHEINSTVGAAQGGYTVFDHSYYFFRWNKGNDEIFSTVAPYWKVAKIFNGYLPDSFETNLPADGWVDRIQIINYPTGGGHISAHTDPDICIRALFGIYLSSPKTDYDCGGFYIMNEYGVPEMLESGIDSGDIVCWYSNLPHGVKPVDPGETTDFSSHDGRWFMALNTVHSHMVKDRYRAMPHVG